MFSQEDGRGPLSPAYPADLQTESRQCSEQGGWVAGGMLEPIQGGWIAIKIAISILAPIQGGLDC
jgi:hypothetical protein